jgi:hypothetical protein
MRLLPRALTAALVGGLLGASALVAVYFRAGEIELTMAERAPRVLWGFHGPERTGDLTFAWTTAQAGVALPGLDRAVAWRCSIRLRGARRPDITLPTVTLSVDGLTSQSASTTNDFAELTIPVPPRPERDGVVLALTASPVFVPGGGDRRELGVQVDHIACRPDARARPPLPSMATAAAVAALFGATFALLGAPLALASAAAGAVGLAQAAPLVSGAALFTTYSERLIPWAAGGAIAALGLALLVRRLTGVPPSPSARFALGYSAAAFYLLLSALTHPSKAVVDAVFHAHRLEWVQAGRYFFTQPMPDGVSFPYAIALYVISSPFMAITRDHVTLLRVVVTAVHVLAGLTLYALIVRRRGDGLAGAFAVVLWPLVPLWYLVVGNANMTNAFGQSVATAALVSAVALLPDRRTWWAVLLCFLLTLVAFLSHVSTFSLLALALGAVAVAFVAVRGAGLRPAGLAIGGLTAAAAVASVLLYYGHFPEAYRSLDRVRGRAVVRAPQSPAPAALDPTIDPTLATTRGAPTPGTLVRVRTAGEVWTRAVGLPLMLLAAAGVWRLWSERRLDALALGLAGWFAAGLAVLAFGVLSPVEPRFYRYMVEFISRVFYATWPALVVLAGLGAAWAWRRGLGGRVAVAVCVGAAFFVGVAPWLDWFTVR